MTTSFLDKARAAARTAAQAAQAAAFAPGRILEADSQQEAVGALLMEAQRLTDAQNARRAAVEAGMDDGTPEGYAYARAAAHSAQAVQASLHAAHELIQTLPRHPPLAVGPIPAEPAASRPRPEPEQ